MIGASEQVAGGGWYASGAQSDTQGPSHHPPVAFCGKHDRGRELLEVDSVGSSAGVCCRRLDVSRFDVVRGRLIIQDRPVFR